MAPPSKTKAAARSLREYRRKRDFKQTPEPSGAAAAPAPANFFIIQKHAASRLHYDFRLAIDGVLKSWAVPKGLPTRKGDKRLAVQVEDHPMDYANFEGTIAPGNYGAGTVMVWDRGEFEMLGGEPNEALKSGKLHLLLKGKKLNGEWTLIRLRPRGQEKENWLILKTGGDVPDISPKADDQSALTRRSMEQIAHANGAEWQSNRRARASSAKPLSIKGSSAKSAKFSSQLGNLPVQAPGFIEPMKALLVEKLPAGPEWVYEIKFDGIRALAIKNGDRFALVSRNKKELRYPDLAAALENQIPAGKFMLDGEIVAIDSDGRPSFQLLQNARKPIGPKSPLFYYAFDLLNLEGRDLTREPLENRKQLLAKLLDGVAGPIQFSAPLQGDPAKVTRQMQSLGLEGIIAKKKHSSYEAGRRSGGWIKFKWVLSQEFVIGGYTPPQGTRDYLGAILVGYYEAGKLLFASKVGTGFNQALLESLHEQFQAILAPQCPFANLPEGPGGLTASAMRKCTWLKPQIVCQIGFAEWTRDGHLRQPRFLGLREDKSATEVVRERPAG